MKRYYVYTHFRKDLNETFYVGIGSYVLGKTQEENFYKRAFTKNKSRNKHWKNVIEKNPDYVVEIVFETDDETKVKEEEVKLIRKYGRRDINTGTLVNMTDGGDGLINASQETLKNMRKRKMDSSKMGKHDKSGEKNPMHGKSLYSTWELKYGEEKAKEMETEHRKNLSNSLKGRSAWNSGIQLGEDFSNLIKDGIQKSKIVCEFCSIELDYGNYKRSHGDRCLIKDAIPRIDQIREMYASGINLSKISKKLEIKYSVIKKLKKIGRL